MPSLLENMAEAFKNLENTVNGGWEIEVEPFTQACSTINSLIKKLPPGPGSVVGDLKAKISAITKASRPHTTLRSMLKAGIERDNVLNLRKVIEVVQLFFEDILRTDFDDQGNNTLLDQGHRAYSRVFGEHLGNSFLINIEKFLDHVPSKKEFLRKLGENDKTSCAANMRAIVDAAPRITAYIDGLM
ncbi:hypothetical protein MKW92_013216 [Papaver armeniacum]|nr:hypothetical protein MKW92_013216 [Papaver armeniacum]